MSVLDPRELDASPLADLHALASELGIEGYRRFRKEELIQQIVSAQGGESTQVEALKEEEEKEEKPKRRRGLRGRRRPAAEEAETLSESGPEEAEAPSEPAPEEDEQEDDTSEDSSDDENDDEEKSAPPAAEEEEIRSGVLDVLPNGSGFLRADPFRQSREDVYVSPAQIRRCELRSGDEVAGPVRPPRRNERHPSLVRVETVNDGPAEPPADRARFDDLKPIYPTERLAGPAALAHVAFGKGSRVAIGGPPGAGASKLLRELARSVAEQGVDVTVVLAGVRPEEVADWHDLGVTVAGGSFDSPPEEQAQVAELAVQRGKRALEAGRDVAVIVDSLDSLPVGAARRVFGAGRNAEGAGSLTVIASSGLTAEPHRMATTRIALEAGEGGVALVSAAQSGTLRSDLLGA